MKDKLGGGYRIHLSTGPGTPSVPEIPGVSTRETFGQIMYIAPDSRQAARVIRQFEASGLDDYQLSGPSIEDVFLKLADEVREERNSSTTQVVTKPEPSSTETKTATVTELPSQELELHTGQPIGFFRQAWVLFRKRLTILRRNYLPYTIALLLPIIAAGLVTLFVQNQEKATCSPDGTIDFNDIDTLASQRYYNLLLGPSERWPIETVMTLFAPLLPVGIAGRDIFLHVFKSVNRPTLGKIMC